jgi:hypothetical protein
MEGVQPRSLPDELYLVTHHLLVQGAPRGSARAR